jgi:hypothetical protein
MFSSSARRLVDRHSCIAWPGEVPSRVGRLECTSASLHFETFEVSTRLEGFAPVA